MALSLGPFDLHAPVARGGTGEVWRAVHRTQGIPVAIKIVTVDLLDEAEFRARFAREVQAMAQLHHPAVAQVFDYGEIAPELSAASEGRLPRRAVWLGMEWLGGGSLHARAGLGWPVLRATLLTLLDALAHAHAHGVIHLDLKPDNVLLAERGPVLTDFGLAFTPAARRSLNDNQVFGTPGYMAPEQIHGRWRDFGPWTDLYALGCLAYEMICGHVPHGENRPGPLPLMMAHVTDPVPPLRTKMALPDGFGEWLDGLLAMAPADRFRFAADAAVALLGLPETLDGDDSAQDSFDSIAEAMGSVEWVEPSSVDIATTETLDIKADAPLIEALTQGAPSRRIPPTSHPPLDDDTLSSGAPHELMAAYDAFVDAPDTFVEAFDPPGSSEATDEEVPFDDDRTLTAGMGGMPPPGVFADAGPTDPIRRPMPTVVMGPVFLPVDDLSWARGPRPDGRPPVPERWVRQGNVPQPPLLDVGEALVRLRTPPPVGREAERDILWDALREAADGQTRLVLIEGPAGQGKTHLARWLGRRGHELGIADRIAVRHSASAEPGNGVGPALSRHLRVEGLDDRARLDRIRQLTGEELDADTSRAFAAALTTERSVKGVTSALMIGSEIEMDTARAAGLEALCAIRPIVLLLDDVQWSRSTLRFVKFLLERRRPMPLLIVCTVRDDALRPGSVERRQVERIGDHERSRVVRLDPLPPADLEKLVTSLLPVSPRLLLALVNRTHGNPLFAVELMRHWIGRGALRAGPDGFRLVRRDILDELPRSQKAVWTARLSHVLRNAEPDAMRAFELAAVLGPVVEQSEWALACVAIKTRRPKEGFRRMLDERLIRPLADGRWLFGNAMLREVLLRQIRDSARWQHLHGVCSDVLRRLGNSDPARLLHALAQAGRDREALPEAVKHADRLLDRGDWIAAESTLIEAALMLRRIRQPSGSRAWTEIGLRWSRACIARGAVDHGLRRALRAARAVEDAGNAHIRARALLSVGHARLADGDTTRAIEAVQRAVPLADQSADRRLSARVRNLAGRCLIQQHRFDPAERALRGALDAVRGMRAPRLLGDAHRHLAELGRLQSRYDSMLSHAAVALERYRELGARRQMGQVELLMGDSLRHQGLTADATDRYRNAGRLLKATGSDEAPRADISLAQTLMELGELHEARPLLDGALAEADARATAVRAVAHGLLLSCVAADEDWPAWDRHLDGVAADTSTLDPDLAQALRRAARLARRAHQDQRAQQAYDIAIAQFTALGQRAEAKATQRESAG